FRAALPAVADAGAVQGAADGVIAHTRQVLDAAAADQDHRVLLEVVSFTADIAGDFEPVGQPHTSHLPHRRVRLLRGGGIDARAHAAFLGASLQGRDGTLGAIQRPRIAY